MDLNLLCEELKIDDRGPLARIYLNRPNALNALDIEMVRTLRAALTSWRDNPEIKAVYITGLPHNSFCSGGDMKAVYSLGMAFRREQINERVACVFFAEEYSLNELIYNYPKPVISFMNGICMGGGYGIAGPSDFRVVCENTVFAMPEGAIGFFPDVGSSFFLNRCPNRFGSYLALTGARINAEDLLVADLADYFIFLKDRDKLETELEKALKGVSSSQECGKSISEVLTRMSSRPQQTGIFNERRSEIESCFSAYNIDGVIEKLGKVGWGAKVIEQISAHSPTSVKVIWQHFENTRDMDFPEVLNKDFLLVQHFINGHDFYEGVRSVLIDKDKNPRWVPASLEEVTSESIESYFSETGYSIEDAMAL